MQGIPQPSSHEESRVQKWQQKMLIPFVVDNKLCAFHGPFPDAKTQPPKVKKFFPCYTLVKPTTFETGVFNLKFMDPSSRVFLFMLAPRNKEYLAWLNKVLSKHKAQWVDADI